MRMPRFRFRLRTLVVAVAVAGTALGGWAMWKRREFCLDRVRQCEFWEKLPRRLAPLFRGPPASSNQAQWRAMTRAQADRAARIRPAYERVARYPWLPLPREPE